MAQNIAGIKKDFHPKTAPDLRHLLNMTRPYGIVQHALGSQPDEAHGFSIDDCARALIAVLQIQQKYHIELEKYAKIYLSYIEKAESPSNIFRNFANIIGEFLDRASSEDAHGRALWALGYAAQNKVAPKIAKKARTLWTRNSERIYHLTPIRSLAFAGIGACYMNDIPKIEYCAMKIVEKFEENALPDWQWFEPIISYSNAILPYFLTFAYEKTHVAKFLQIASKSAEFLESQSRLEDYPAPVGQAGDAEWFQRGGIRQPFDQQVVDSADKVIANAKLYQVTKIKKYKTRAYEWMAWFYGNNVHELYMIDINSGGVYDGLTSIGVNTNQGAESIVCYLLAYVAIAEIL